MRLHYTFVHTILIRIPSYNYKYTLNNDQSDGRKITPQRSAAKRETKLIFSLLGVVGESEIDRTQVIEGSAYSR